MRPLRPRNLALVATLAAAMAAASALGAFDSGGPAATATDAPQAREAALAALDTALIQARQPAAPVVRDAFARHSWALPAPPPPPAPAPPPAAPPLPPQAPALPFKYLGTLEEAPSPTVWYLAAGERLVVASSGETIDGLWRVDGLRDSRLLFTYLPLDQRLSLAIGGPP